jgi:hypothetical protein
MFNGPDYDPKHDYARLRGQHERVRDLMLGGDWYTLSEISEKIGDPPASISAQLRHLRKERFGGFVVEKRCRGDRGSGLYEYRVLDPKEAA